MAFTKSAAQRDDLRSQGRCRVRRLATAVLAALALVLTSCEVEIDHLFLEDGSVTYQTAIGDEIDEENGESIDCDAGDDLADQGFQVAYNNREERGSQTWCITGVDMQSTRQLEQYYDFFNENGEFIRVNCLSMIDGDLVYDVDVLIDNPDWDEDTLVWRVTAPSIITTNADSRGVAADRRGGETAVWDLTGRSGWISMQINVDTDICPNPDFALSLVAESDSAGMATIFAANPSSDEADTQALLGALNSSGWQTVDGSGEIVATRSWQDADGLQAVANSIEALTGSSFSLTDRDDGGIQFDARLDLSFYEAFWQGLNPAIEDPSFQFRWTPPADQVESSGDWTDLRTPSFDWNVDQPGRIFNLSTTSWIGATPAMVENQRLAEERANDARVDGPDAYGIVEQDGNVYINSEPGRPLNIRRADLPTFLQDTLASVGAVVVTVGPPSEVSTGDGTVLIDGLPAARVGDSLREGGVIVQGSSRVFINGVPAATVGEGFAVAAMNGRVGGPIVLAAPGDCSRIVLETYGGGVSQSQLADYQSALDGCLQEQFRRFRLTLSAIEVGATRVEVSTEDFEIGDRVVIGNDPATREERTVVDKGSIILDRPLEYDHPAGTMVQRLSSGEELPATNLEAAGAAASANSFSADENEGIPVLVIAASVVVAVLLATGVAVKMLRGRRNS